MRRQVDFDLLIEGMGRRLGRNGVGTVKITLRYFATIRETLGRGEETRTVATGTTAAELFNLLAEETPRLAPMRPATMFMVNQEFSPADRPLSDGDELALIPPVSGGDGADGRFRVQAEPLDPRPVEASVAGPGAGAVVTFTGVVRDNARGQVVTTLDYEAFVPAAEKMLAQIGREIEERWGLPGVAIVHRTGSLSVGEASVIIAVAAPHRGEAFAACAYAIERIKEIVPIWKKEHYADGASWIGSEADYQREVRSPATSATEAV